MQTFAVSFLLYKAPVSLFLTLSLGRREAESTTKQHWQPEPPLKCKNDKCDGTDPTLGGHELGTTATELSFVEVIHVLPCLIAKILCHSWQVIPASSRISVLLE